jgi:hypothetical protein
MMKAGAWTAIYWSKMGRPISSKAKEKAKAV